MFDYQGRNMSKEGEFESKKESLLRVTKPKNKSMLNCSSFLTGMSREMRTQMNAIVSFSFLLNRKEYNNEEREEFCNQIFNCCEQIIGMVDNFLDTEIIDTGNSTTESGFYKPNKVLNELFSEFRETIKKNQFKDLIFVSENQSFNSDGYLINSNMVTRVIRNLFQNALSNTRTGYIKAGYYFRNNNLTFYILDSGQGYFKCKEFIQTEDMALSLAKFNDPYTAANLFLAQKLIQMMDGFLWIECNGLTGSGIYFSIPVHESSTPEKNTSKKSDTMITI